MKAQEGPRNSRALPPFHVCRRLRCHPLRQSKALIGGFASCPLRPQFGPRLAPSLPPRDHLYTADCSRLTVGASTGCRGSLPGDFYAGARHTSPIGAVMHHRWGLGSHSPHYVTAEGQAAEACPIRS